MRCQAPFLLTEAFEVRILLPIHGRRHHHLLVEVEKGAEIETTTATWSSEFTTLTSKADENTAYSTR